MEMFFYYLLKIDICFFMNNLGIWGNMEIVEIYSQSKPLIDFKGLDCDCIVCRSRFIH